MFNQRSNPLTLASPGFSGWDFLTNHVVVILASVGINVLALAVPLYINHVYVSILPQAALDSLLSLTILIVLVIAVEILLKVGRLYVSSWTGARFEHGLRSQLVARLLASDLPSHSATSAATHVEQLTSVSAIRDFYTTQLVTLLVDVPFAGLYLAVLYYLGGWVVWVPLVLMPVFLLIALILSGVLRWNIAQRHHQDVFRNDFVIRVLEGAETLKAMGLGAFLTRRYEPFQERSSRLACRVTQLTTLIQNLGALLSQLSLIGIVTLGSIAIFNNQMNVGALAACTLLSGRIVQPFQSSLSFWVSFQTVQLAQKRIQQVKSLPQEAGVWQNYRGQFSGATQIRNLCYGSDQPDSFCLDNVNLTLQPGQTLVLRGGTHQSATLFQLMLGLLQPTQGTIQYDGIPLSEWNLQELRSHIAYINPREALFNGTILQNLTLFRTESMLERALDLSALLGIDSAVKRLPAGYDTLVGGHHSQKISDVLHYRILVARALLDHPKLLLFEEEDLEVTLDPESRKLRTELQQRFRGQFTVLWATAEAAAWAESCDARYVWVNNTLQEE